MIYAVENDEVKITVSDHGAELQSITEKSDGTEYLWHGDPKFWKYRSPILFPIVGKLVDGQYRVDGKIYELPAHGLGRISDFMLIEQTTDSITFELKYSEESLAVYPYKFALQVRYTVQGKSVQVGWKVKNLDDKKIYFSIGAHPALLCPIDPKDSLADCYLEFSQMENVQQLEITPECYIKRTQTDSMKNSNIFPLKSDTFKDGVYIYDRALKSDTISIKSRNNDKAISVTAKDFPFWGIWSPEKGGAPFVCIEPWHGHADYADFTGEFKDKEDNTVLGVGEEFNTQYAFHIK